MIEHFIYWAMQKIGYRKLYFDRGLYIGVNLSGYDMWSFHPSWEKGTYRERRQGYHFAGYGTDK